MRRTLVLTDEAARHPFRQGLPPLTVEPLPQREPITDLAFFSASFISCFIIIMGMIA